VEKLSEYVKIAEAARILGVSQNTLRAWASDGRVPVTRNPVNGYRLFRRLDLEQLLQRIGESFGECRPRTPRKRPF
jgi:excisionase family DNA binding protein